MKWTLEEITEFNKLIELSSSKYQMNRIQSRLKLPKFIGTHGREKCDAMFEYLKAHKWKPGVPDNVG